MEPYHPKWQVFSSNFLLCAFSLFCVLMMSVETVTATDTGEMAKQANQELRQSQRAMFNGKLDDSLNHLSKADELISQIKSADPGFSQLKSLAAKYEKQRKDLEKRMPKAAQPASQPEPAVSTASGEKSDKLPKTVTRRLDKIDKTLSQLEDLFGKFQEKPTDSLANELDRYTQAVGNQMEQLMKYYGDKIPVGHPEVKEREDKIAAYKEKYNKVTGGYAESKQAAATAKAAGKQEALVYKEKLESLYDKYRDDFEGVYGNTVVYDFNPQSGKEQLKKIRHLEKRVLPATQPLLAEIAEKYGSTPMEVNNKLHELGIPSNEQFGSEFEELYRGVENVMKSKKATAEFIARQAKDRLANVENLMSDIRVKRMKEVKEMLGIAHEFDPNNPDVNSLLVDLDRQIVEMAEKIEKQIDSATWAGHISDFAGPGNVKALAKTAVDYFQNHSQWGKVPGKGVEVLAVAVRGQWKMAETNIFGQIIRWRLPIHIAVTNNELKPKNIARVYELSALTLQGPPDQVEKAPPYDGYWVGNNWMMRIDNLK